MSEDDFIKNLDPDCRKCLDIGSPDKSCQEKFGCNFFPKKKGDVGE